MINHEVSDTPEASYNELESILSLPAPVVDTTIIDTFDFEALLAETNGEVQSLPAAYDALQDNDPVSKCDSQIDNLYPPFPELPESIVPHLSSLHSFVNSQEGITSTDIPQVRQGHHVKELEQQVRPKRTSKAGIRIKEVASKRPDLRRLAGESESKNARPFNIASFDPSIFYKPLARPPPSWSPPHIKRRRTLFNYNAQGELDPRTRFSAQEISDYLTHHPLHKLYSCSPSTKNSGLTLWIQISPADSSNRYPTAMSSRCRFANCPVPQHTIRKGEFRVAFDEQSCSGKPLDPFHNAGYVHLFCLEKNFDFPRLCKNFNVRGDDREFREGRNKMAITRDHSTMLHVVNRFIETSEKVGDKRSDDWYVHSLCYALTIHHLKHQPERRQSIREARDGNSVDRHLNNLDVLVERARVIREQKASQGKKSRAPRKRKVKEVEFEEEDVLDDNILESIEVENGVEKGVEKGIEKGVEKQVEKEVEKEVEEETANNQERDEPLRRLKRVKAAAGNSPDKLDTRSPSIRYKGYMSSLRF